ncbi:MAG: hypothetical protein HC882_02080 [Acidobacteria bacterium]|nr:hypothetical protein [Acidobacteriota bacterium]
MNLRRTSLLFIVPWIISLACGPAAAQYFGKNKISYSNFEWKVYASPHFDVHYYAGMENQLEQVVNELESAYLDISRILDHELTKRVPVILYQTQRDFQQTNVLLTEIPDAVGAFAEPFQNRLVMPIDDPPDRRYVLARHELTHVFQFDILYADSLRRALRGAPPLWLMEGMASYIGDDEDSFDQMVIRDAVVNNLIPSVRQLDVLSFLTYRYGHAIFDFMEEEYGPERVRTFLFEFRRALLAQNLEKAFEDSFGLSVDAFDRQFARFLRRKYLPVLTGSRSPDEYGKEIGISRPGVFTFSPALSPSGELVATLSNTSGLELDVVVLSAKDGEKIRNVTRGFTNRYEQIVAEAFEGKRDLAWSPASDEVAFFVKKEQYTPLAVYDPLTGRRLGLYRMGEIASCASPAYSPDGTKVAFSGNLDGVWDLFTYDFATGAITNVTADSYYDSNPTWSADGSQIVYNRRIGLFEKVFAVDIGAKERKTQLTAGAASDLQPALSRDGKFVYFVSDRGRYGVFNLHRLELATGAIERLTDLSGGAFSPVELPDAEDGAPVLAYTAYYAGTFRLYRMKLAGEEVDRSREIGREEPRNSPLAPSRRDDKIQAIRADEVGEESPAPRSPEETEDEDLEPFSPPLSLGIDEERKKPYKVEWNLDAPSLTVGITDDGTFLGETSLVFSDLLGDQRAVLRIFAYGAFSNYEATYFNLKRRLKWGARVYDYRDYYLFIDNTGNVESERATRFTSATAFALYPLNRYWRVEGSAGYAQRRQDYPLADPQTGQIFFERFSDDFPIVGIDLVADTVRYQNFGAYHGYQMRLGLEGQFYTSGDNSGESVYGLNLDLRGYQKLTRRSLLAARVVARLQDGPVGTIYSIGGIDQIRGLRFRELFGDNAAFVNLEYRFPLFDGIRWSFGMITAPVRAFAFVDAGSAWFDELAYRDPDSGEIVVGRAVFDRNLGVYRAFDAEDDDGKLKDLYATAGLGFTAPILGLPATWSFARVYDGDEFGTWESSFYILYSW